jgi:hypothetical protein
MRSIHSFLKNVCLLELMDATGPALLFLSLWNPKDLNRNGIIMYTEFLAATIEACGRIEEDRIAEAFDRYVAMANPINLCIPRQFH